MLRLKSPLSDDGSKELNELSRTNYVLGYSHIGAVLTIDG